MNSWMSVMKIEYAVMELHASVMILGACVMKLTHSTVVCCTNTG